MPFKTVNITIPNQKLRGESYWTEIKAKGKIKPFTSRSDKYEILTTSPRSYGILKKMLEMIDKAERQIFLASFILDNKEIEEALVKAAKRLHGRVHVLTVLDTTVFNKAKQFEEGGMELLLDHQRLKRLAESGVYIREHSSCHAKFLVVDEEEVLVTSANVRDTSLKQNIEIGVWTKEREVVRSFSKLYQHLWIHDTRMHYRPVKGKAKMETIPWKHTTKTPPEPVNCTTWTREVDNYLLDDLVSLIKNSKNYQCKMI